MTILQEIENAIEGLPREQFLELVRHLRARHADDWDNQVEHDAQSGQLQKLYERLQREDGIEAEVPLDAFLNDKKLS